MQSELVAHNGALHRRTVVENFEPVELSQLQGNVTQRQAEADQATSELLRVARNAQSVEELTDVRENESKAQAALAEAKSELENGQSVVDSLGSGTDASTEAVDGSVENQY